MLGTSTTDTTATGDVTAGSAESAAVGAQVEEHLRAMPTHHLTGIGALVRRGQSTTRHTTDPSGGTPLAQPVFLRGVVHADNTVTAAIAARQIRQTAVANPLILNRVPATGICGATHDTPCWRGRGFGHGSIPSGYERAPGLGRVLGPGVRISGRFQLLAGRWRNVREIEMCRWQSPRESKDPESERIWSVRPYQEVADRAVRRCGDEMAEGQIRHRRPARILQVGD